MARIGTIKAILDFYCVTLDSVQDFPFFKTLFSSFSSAHKTKLQVLRSGELDQSCQLNVLLLLLFLVVVR